MSETTLGLVEEFAEAVAGQEDALQVGDSVLGNQLAKKYVSTFRKLREIGDEGREALTALFNDERPSVRVMAASFLLRYRHEQARMILETEAKGQGFVAFGAAQALKRWEDGSWSLDS